jgi:hypothetical protein
VALTYELAQPDGSSGDTNAGFVSELRFLADEPLLQADEICEEQIQPLGYDE